MMMMMMIFTSSKMKWRRFPTSSIFGINVVCANELPDFTDVAIATRLEQFAIRIVARLQ